MKVLFILPENFIGGGIFNVLEHAQRLSRGGYSVVVAFVDTASSLRVDAFDPKFDVPLVHVGDIEKFGEFDIAIATAWQTVYSLPGVFARRFAYFVQDDERRFFAPPHNRTERFLAGATYRDQLYFITTTDWLREMLQREFAQKAEVVLYAIEPSRFASQTPVVPKGNKLRVLIEGRAVEPRKRIPLSFAVAAAVDGIEVFYVSSAGVCDPDWRCDAFFPKVPSAQMPAIYASCDVLLKLSSQESFSLPVVEMFASGGTAVVSAFTGHDQHSINGHNALVVPVDDQAAAVAALTKLRDDPALLSRLRANARVTAERFSWERSSLAMRQALDRIAADARSRPQTLRLIRRLQLLYKHRFLPGHLRRKLANLARWIFKGDCFAATSKGFQ